jgi:pimeloyl-ACP methyl ester carboxylesterase
MKETRFAVPVEGGELVGYGTGSGDPALVLHGGPGLSDYSAALAWVLATKGLRALRYQQRGVTPSLTSGPFDVETHVSDAIAVLDAHGIERALVVGHSWGGHLAFHVAVAHPERVAAVIAIGTLGAVGDGGWATMGETMLARLERISPAAAARGAALEELEAPTDEEALESLRLFWPTYFADSEKAIPMPPLRLNAASHVAAAASIMEHFERGTLAQGLPRFEAPFVLIHGVEDPLPLASVHETAALVSHAVVETLPDAGHFPWIEQVEPFDAALSRALTQ